MQTSPDRVDRTRAAAVMIGAMSLAYLGLSIWYFWVDWFQYLRPNAPMMSDPAGLSVHVAGYMWTILSPWRIPLAILSVMLLALSAARLWRGTPNARVLALATLWGVLLPQVFWYTELVVDWYQGQIGTVLAYGLFAVLMPTALLYDGAQTFGGWGAQVSRGRLFATATLLGWIAFLGTNLLDHSYQTDSTLACVGALLAVCLGGAAAVGILRLRTWALWAGVAAAVALALVPLAMTDARYLHSGGYIDAFVYNTSGTGARAFLSAVLPVATIWMCAAPFLHAFVKKCVKGIEAL